MVVGNGRRRVTRLRRVMFNVGNIGGTGAGLVSGLMIGLRTGNPNLFLGATAAGPLIGSEIGSRVGQAAGRILIKRRRRR